MSYIQFARNILMVPGENGSTRSVSLTTEDTQQLYKYYTTIPEPVRPRQYTDNPLFAAFDFNRGTYRWMYEKDAPKAFSEVAIQKMVRLEDLIFRILLINRYYSSNYLVMSLYLR